MKVLIKFFIIIFPAILVAQANEIIQNKKFQAIIFSKTYKSPYHTFLNENSRFTPSIKDIEPFELNLKKKVKLINKKQWNQEGSCPIIHKNLCKYNRQYLGFTNENGRKYLLINFIWKDSHENEEMMDSAFFDEFSNWKKHWQVIFDGCSYYWNVKYYLDTDELFDLQINGSS
uniref:hypothetical protein n=1 Tax=Flavobacterium sp. TaxID=239 RepID=UPI00404AEBC9